jgi:hypothetical protein
MNLSLSQIGGSFRFFASEYFYDFRIKNNFCAESEIVSEIKVFRRFAAMNKWTTVGAGIVTVYGNPPPPPDPGDLGGGG